MELDTLHTLYVERLRDLYSAEQQLLKAMPTLRQAVTNDELMEAFDTHLAQTEQQVQRLERIFEALGVPPKGKHCKGMAGLLAEAHELLGEDAEPDVLDAGIIASAQAVEHYEIAGYGTVRAYSELLGYDDHTELLQQTLTEEEETDRLLTEIAMSSVNLEALEAMEAVDATEDEGDGEAGAPIRASRGSRAGKTTSKKRSVGKPEGRGKH